MMTVTAPVSFVRIWENVLRSSWWCTVWFLIGAGALLAGVDLPSIFLYGALFSPAIALLGSLLALIFLIGYARTRQKVQHGMASLAINITCYFTFMNTFVV